jgi:hypothetical protein
VVELVREAEAPGRLLLEALEEVDRGPQRARDVADVVVRVCTLERGQRSRIPPTLEEAALVPRIGRRVDGTGVPLEQRHEAPLHVPVEARDRGEDLASPELLRRPQRVVPEIARELRECRRVG